MSDVDPDGAPPRPGLLYRYYDSAGVLLYIGVTTRTIAVRTGEHRRTKTWAPEIRRVEVVRFTDVEQAFQAERVEVRRRRPKYNELLRGREEILIQVLRRCVPSWARMHDFDVVSWLVREALRQEGVHATRPQATRALARFRRQERASRRRHWKPTYSWERPFG